MESPLQLCTFNSDSFSTDKLFPGICTLEQALTPFLFIKTAVALLVCVRDLVVGLFVDLFYLPGIDVDGRRLHL